jgi:5-methyltetrahydrofolate--homocysteine methyltransferase
MMQEILNEIRINLEAGRAKIVKERIVQAIEEEIDVSFILNTMLDGMNNIGEKFKNNDIFVPEVLVAARAMNQGLELIKPLMIQHDVKPIGKAIIGTVEGDLHDIGKNLVKMMFVGTGIEVIDLGVDVKPHTFVEQAVSHNVQLICMSALLTTTMAHMRPVIALLEEKNIRNQFTVMVGGAPLTSHFAKQIGADFTASDAATAAQYAKSILSNRG